MNEKKSPIVTINCPFLPPSVNACYRSYRGKVCKSKLYREYEQKMKLYLSLQTFEIMEGDIKLDIDFYKKGNRKYDIDNRLKALFDTLEGTVFLNDNQITEIHVKKYNNALYDRTIVKIINIG